jgi:EPS-associated MarR family transcriptional regulator
MPPSTPSPPTELDLQLLQALDQAPAASQRSLAARLGISVGKVNFCLRALVDKGWVKAQNFRRSDNKWAYAYLLTPHGVRARMALTRDFLKRKEAEFEALRLQIHAMRHQLQTDGDSGDLATAPTPLAGLGADTDNPSTQPLRARHPAQP